MTAPFDQLPFPAGTPGLLQVTRKPLLTRPANADGFALACLWHAHHRTSGLEGLRADCEALTKSAGFVSLTSLNELHRDTGSDQVMVIFSDLTVLVAVSDPITPDTFRLWPVVLAIPDAIVHQEAIFRIDPEKEALVISCTGDNSTALALRRQLIREASSWARLALRKVVLIEGSIWPPSFTRNEIQPNIDAMIVSETRDLASFLAYRTTGIGRVRIRVQSALRGQGGLTPPRARVSMLERDRHRAIATEYIANWVDDRLFGASPAQGFVCQHLSLSKDGSARTRSDVITTSIFHPSDVSAHMRLRLHRKFEDSFCAHMNVGA
jgi:hypothetical protein